MRIELISPAWEGLEGLAEQPMSRSGVAIRAESAIDRRSVRVVFMMKLSDALWMVDESVNEHSEKLIPCHAGLGIPGFNSRILWLIQWPIGCLGMGHSVQYWHIHSCCPFHTGMGGDVFHRP